MGDTDDKIQTLLLEGLAATPKRRKQIDKELAGLEESTESLERTRDQDRRADVERSSQEGQTEVAKPVIERLKGKLSRTGSKES